MSDVITEEEAPALPEIDLPEGWMLAHHSPEQTIQTSETQGESRYVAAEYRAEKYLPNGTLANASAATKEGLIAACAAIDANWADEASEAQGAPASEPPVLERLVIDPESLEITPEKIDSDQSQLETVLTADGAFTEEEWSGRSRTDTVITDEGQLIYSGVGESTDAIADALANTAYESADAENAATKEKPEKTDELVYDTNLLVDAPGVSAGGYLIVPKGVTSLEEAAQVMAEASQAAENERVTGDAASGGDGEQPPSDEEDTSADAVNATDAAVAAAEELGVDLSTVEGTGTDGRITKADVESAAS